MKMTKPFLLCISAKSIDALEKIGDIYGLDIKGKKKALEEGVINAPDYEELREMETQREMSKAPQRRD